MCSSTSFYKRKLLFLTNTQETNKALLGPPKGPRKPLLVAPEVLGRSAFSHLKRLIFYLSYFLHIFRLDCDFLLQASFHFLSTAMSISSAGRRQSGPESARSSLHPSSWRDPRCSAFLLSCTCSSHMRRNCTHKYWQFLLGIHLLSKHQIKIGRPSCVLLLLELLLGDEEYKQLSWINWWRMCCQREFIQVWITFNILINIHLFSDSLPVLLFQ